MKNILILLSLMTFISCGLSEEEKRKLADDANAQQERVAKNYLDQGIKYFHEKNFQSAKYVLKKAIDYYSTTNSAGRAKIIMDSVQNEEKLLYPNPNTYEIVTTNHMAQCKNYHILLKFKDHSQNKINDFVKGFIAQYSDKGKICTITMYTSKSISELMTKYPLSKSEYKKLAKYTIASWSFDTNEVWLDPYKDAFLE